ncbi:hypothetical protein DENIS_0055 [Desulfonema ishimotonii]|uniref:Competence protein A n=1 Tax=Desulfonema ishimotonii TaxID=45657 RepID=A0A401FQ45_9BACT|nr:hypothetical protein [Desulfonema ishimotonii]GBC59119.1 hypothetical protein DENIS_0055 [Desulfonema ishimotonii]
MSRYDENSSMQWLIDKIRSGGHQGDRPLPVATPGMNSESDCARKKRLFPFKKKTTVGIELQQDCLKLVRVRQNSEHHRVITTYRTASFDPDISEREDAFSRFLKANIKPFCNSGKNIEVWLTASVRGVEIRYMRFQKIPKRRLAKTVQMMYQRKHAFDGKSFIFDFNVLGEVVEDGVAKLEVVAYIAPRAYVESLQKIFLRAGIALTGISAYSFALQNLFRSDFIGTHGKNICCLHIGTDGSRIDIFSARGELRLSRNIKACVSHMVEAVRDSLRQEADAQTHLGLRPMGIRQARELFFRWIYGETDSDGPPEDLLRIIAGPLERLALQIERTIDYYLFNIEKEAVQTVYLSGEIIANRSVVESIGAHLNYPLKLLEIAPAVFPTASSAEDTPENPAPERRTFTSALGMALSGITVTPNFLFTYRKKQKQVRLVRLHYLIILFFLLMMVIAAGGYYWQRYMIAQKDRQIAVLDATIERQKRKNGLYVAPALISLQLEKIKKKRENARAYIRKYLGLSVIGDIVEATADKELRLTQLTVRLRGDKKKGMAQKSGAPQDGGKSVVIEGYISGNPSAFEGKLTGYLGRLKRRKILGAPMVRKKIEKQLQGRKSLYFVIYMDILWEE